MFDVVGTSYLMSLLIFIISFAVLVYYKEYNFFHEMLPRRFRNICCFFMNFCGDRVAFFARGIDLTLDTMHCNHGDSSL